MGYDSFLASILTPITPYGQGMHNAGAGMSDMADLVAKQKSEAAAREIQRQQLAQQAAGQQMQNTLGNRNADITSRYHDQQDQLRRDQMDAKAQQERAARINGLRDMLGKARQSGDVGMMQSIDGELKRNGWSINDVQSAAPPPPMTAPGGLPQVAPKPELIPTSGPPQADGTPPAPVEAPGGLPAPGGVKPAAPGNGADNPLMKKLSPAGQQQLQATATEMGISTDALLHMMNRESGMKANIIGGDGRHSGLYQLEDGQARKMFNGKRLADLPDNEQIASYSKYSAGRNIHSDVDLMINQLAPARLGEKGFNSSDPNAVLYTAEQTAKWKDDDRKINAALLNPDGSMTVGSASKGYGISAAGGERPNPIEAPGGLPAPNRASAGAREYRDERGNLVERYDGEAEHQRMASLIKDSLAPLGYDPSNPASKAAGEMAANYGQRMMGMMTPKEAVKEAASAYQSAMARASKGAGNGGVSSQDKEDRIRLNGVGDDVRSAVSQVSSMEKYNTLPAQEASIKASEELLNSDKFRSGFGDKVALGQVTSAMYGKNVSNAEYERQVNANGLWERIQNGINQITDDGRLPPGLREDLNNFNDVSKRNLMARREEAGRAAENLVRSTVLTAKPEEQEKLARAARNAFTHEYEDGGEKPTAPAAAPRTETPPAGGSPIVDDAKKRALERARKLGF